MTTDEVLICEYMRKLPDAFVSVAEICKRAAGKRRYVLDRDWARGVLRRMESDGLVESNEFGQFRLREEALKKEEARFSRNDPRCYEAIKTYMLALSVEDDERPFANLLDQVVMPEESESPSSGSK